MQFVDPSLSHPSRWSRARWPPKCQKQGWASRPDMPWYAVHTRSRHEDRVHRGLTQKAFHSFLPKMEVWSKRKDRRKKIMIPMFPGYVFVELLSLNNTIKVD